MIKIENAEVFGWEAAIRGMRNPMNSWDKSDSSIISWDGVNRAFIGPEDYALMKKLVKAGTDHRKYLRMLTVYVDITAPLYWWKEFDTYKVGTVANSCSTMHKIAEKEFTLDDFSHEHLLGMSNHDDERCIPKIDMSPFRDGSIVFSPEGLLEQTIGMLNICRGMYVECTEKLKYHRILSSEISPVKELQKQAWWQMIQLLPSSYNQKRTVMMSYEVLANIYKSRNSHKQDEWNVDCAGSLCEWIKSLPYSELIVGEGNNGKSEW